MFTLSFSFRSVWWGVQSHSAQRDTWWGSGGRQDYQEEPLRERQGWFHEGDGRHVSYIASKHCATLWPSGWEWVPLGIVHSHLHIHTHAGVHIYMHTHICTCTHTRMCTDMHIHTSTWHTQIHTQYVHTHMVLHPMHIHAYGCVCVSVCMDIH